MATVTVWRQGRKLTVPEPEQLSLAIGPTRVMRLKRPDFGEFRLISRRKEGLLGPLQTATLVAGRAIFGGYFLYNGVNHARNVEQLSAWATSKQVPFPRAAVIGSGALIAVGGLSLLLGVKPKAGAGLIGAFLLGVSPAMHDFWNRVDPQAKMNDKVQFLKNMALIGGASLAAAVPEPWPASAGNH